MSTSSQAIPQPQSLSPAAPISASISAPAASTTKINRLGLFSLIFAHTSVDMQTSSLTVLLPLLLATFNLNYASSAVIISVNNLIIAVSQPLFGILGDRRPMRWLLFVGCVLTGTAMVAVLFLPSYPLVLLAVALSGIGSAMYHPEALSTVRAVSGNKQASGTSFFFFGGNLGFALGPFLATALITLFGKVGELGMIVPTLFALSVLLTQRRLFQSHVSTAKVKSAFTPTARRRVFGLVVFLLALIAVRSTILSGLQTFIPLYFSRYTTMLKEQIALFVTVLIFSGAFGTLLGGPISERVGRRNTMAGAMVVVLAALFVFLRTEGIVQFIAIGVAGAFITVPWPISVVMVQEAMPNNIGLASGLTLGLAYGASGLGVAALGKFADVAGLPQAMLVITLLPIAVFFMSLFVPEKQQAVSQVLAPVAGATSNNGRNRISEEEMT